jgi:hypothetical protein
LRTAVGLNIDLNARQDMTITIDLPAETERRLLARALATGKDVSTLVREAVEEKLQTPLPTFAEILAPIHEDFRKSGMSEAELDALLEQELADARRERREKQSKAS